MARATVQTTFSALDRMTGPVAKMTKGIDKFGANAKKSFSGVGQTVSRLRGVFVAAAAALTTGAIAKAINDFGNMGDEIAKTSRRLGLSVEGLQELRFAADRAGVSQETLDKSFEQLNKRMGEMKAGKGELLSFLKATDRALLDNVASAGSSEEAFVLLMDAIDKEKDTAKRAAIANAVFGRAGQDLISMAEGGAKAIGDLRDEARRYGNIISTEAAEKSEAFNDSMTNLKNSMNSIRNNALGPLVGALQPLIQGMAEWIAANRELIGQRIQSVIDGIGTAVRIVADLWNSGLIPAVLAGVAAFKAITLGIAAYQAALALAKGVQLAFNLAMTANPIGLIIVAISTLIGLIVLLVQNLEKVKAFFDSIGRGIGKFGDAMRSIGPGPLGGEEYDALNDPTGLTSKNQSLIESRSVTESRQSVDINVGGLPQGTTIKERGTAPAVKLNYGFSGVRGMN